MFTFENDKCYRMPAFFGGWTYQPAETCYHDVLAITFTCATDGDRLSVELRDSATAPRWPGRSGRSGVTSQQECSGSSARETLPAD